jgi:Domain of unknown function (DUF4177)
MGAIMKWEYHVEPFAFDEVATTQNALDEMGRDGWELVTIVATVWGKHQTWPAAIYKRPHPPRRKAKTNRRRMRA